MPRSFTQRLLDAVNNQVYPANVDWFAGVEDGTGPFSVIWADYINKISNALHQVELHTQYTCVSANPTGSLVYAAQRHYVLPATLDLPGQRLSVPLTCDATIAQTQFQGSPFARVNGVMVSAIGWTISGGFPSYFPVRAGVNVGRELNNLTATVNCIKGSRWLKNDLVEVTLTVLRP